MRRQAALLAAFSAVAPAALLGAALLSVLLLPSGLSPRAPIYLALALLAGVGVARGVLLRRLTTAEQAAVRFWSFAPTLALLIASVLGALPVVVLDALRIRISTAVLSALASALALAAGLVVWALWLRLRDSLSEGAPKSAVNGRADGLQKSR